MIAITGAAGFIASVVAQRFNDLGFFDLILVDDFSHVQKAYTTADLKFTHKIERSIFVDWLKSTDEKIDFVFHLGARTDTTEMNVELFNTLNLHYSQAIWKVCTEKNIPLVYASSAATYGLGEFGYKDDHEVVNSLKPLNPYGESKNDFDKWVLTHKNSPFVIKEAAILFESGAYKDCDYIISVSAPIETRIKRVMERDQTTREQVQQRINNQMSDEERNAKSDFVISNTYSDDFKTRVDEIIKILKNK
jgi:dephospho-CoA kinase